MTIQLDRATEQKLIASIRRYVAQEFAEEIGDLKASLLLRFCLEEIGPSIYNRAIADAKQFMQEKAEDLENVCFAPEFGFWKPEGRKAREKR